MNTSRTLGQLEGNPWPPAPSDASPMAIRCHALRKVSLSSLSAGDCRLLIGQDVGTKYLVPLALAFLEQDPLVEGDHYRGDLLSNLLGVQEAHWLQHPNEHERLVVVARRASVELTKHPEPSGSDRKLLKDVDTFLQRSDA